MPPINAKQVVLMILSLLSFTAAATTQLTDVFGPTTAKAIASLSSLLGGMMSAAMTPFLSNSSVAKDASQLPGVEVQVSREAAQPIAALAVSNEPGLESIAPAAGEERAVADRAVA